MREYNENELLLVWLSILPRNRNIKQSLAMNAGRLRSLWHMNDEELMILKKANKKFHDGVMNAEFRYKAEIAYNKALNENIKLITLNDEKYPEILKTAIDAPTVLFYKGDILKCRNCISVIGSRKATAYGMRAAEEISGDLARRGACIVSGMARGIDSAAHRGALSMAAGANESALNVGTTCAVVGSGLDVIYPPENESLFNEICKKGVVISEYAPETLPLPQNFPARNRIISGLSQGLVVVEAGKESGTLITVDFALEQGRDVFAIPGNIYSVKSMGTNNLIKDGARLITDAEEIAQEYDFLKSNTSKYSELRQYIIESLESGFFEAEETEKATGQDIKVINIELMQMEMEGLIRKYENGEYFLTSKNINK